MSPIADIQARYRELGRIRLGYQEDTGKTYTSGPRKGQPIMRPVKIDRFRLTSQWGQLIDQAAQAYGGQVSEWTNQGQREFQVITELADDHGVAYLPIVIPTTSECFSQWYELWTGAGLERRCDGITQKTNSGAACVCPSDPDERDTLAKEGKACRVTTRQSVMLPDLSDMGTWRVETHGWHAASEMGGVADLLENAAGHGAAFIPAELRLQEKTVRKPGQPVRKFYVPAISFRGRLGLILDSLGVVAGALPAPSVAALPPAKPVSVIEQLYADVTRRANTLDPSDRSRLVSWCADQKPPIPLNGVTIDGVTSTKKIGDVPQGMVQAIQGWLDAFEATIEVVPVDAETVP